MVEAILTSPVGREAVKAAWGHHVGEFDGRKVEAGIAAALERLTSDVCPTCDGDNPSDFRSYCPNPDCDNGKVKPALYTQAMLDDYVL